MTSRKNCEACENLAIRRSQIGSVERRTFTFEQQCAQLDFIVQENEFLIWYETIITIVDQKLSDLFQGTHSQTFNKVKKSLWPSPLLKLKACFSRQVDVVPPQPVAAKVTVLYVAVHLNLRSVLPLCGHLIQIHSCMSICFSCMYTSNFKHFHKWFGIFYCDNSVLTRVLHIQ